MKEIKQPKAAKEKNVGKKVIGGIVFIAIMLIAYAILSMQQIGEIKSIAPETARALEENEFAVTMIVKDKETGEVLPGAKIIVEAIVVTGIWGQETTYEQIGEYTTNDEGKIELVLEKGITYRISETTAPSGYKPIESIFSVGYSLFNFPGFVQGLSVAGDAVTNGEVEYVEADEVIYVYNEEAQIINIVDLDGTPLSGAIFSIDGKEYKTDGNGKIVLEFEDGDYTITELTAPDGYAKVKETISVSIQDGKWVLSGDYGDSVKVEEKELYIVNESLTPVELNVVDGEGNPLEGAKLEVSYMDGTAVGEYTSDKEGKIKLNLENGDYIITEVTVPDGYRMTVRNVHIRVKNGTYYVLNNDGTEKSEADKTTVVAKNLKEIAVNSYGADGELIPIPGATYDIYDYSEDKFIGEFTTDENGKIDLELEPGEYAVIEKGLPEEYGTVSHINVKSQDGNIELLYSFGDVEKNAIYFVNEPNRLVINKIDEEGNPLPGAVFAFGR